jgi:hypothetical protein
MRKLLFAASAIAALAIPAAASAQFYYQGGYYAPGTAYVAPAPGMVQSQVYLAPPAAVTVTPGAAYDDQAIYINGDRYYRDCWWDWGHRRCELKRWW